MLWLFWLLGRGVGSFDGIDRDERHCEQLAGTRDILGAGLAGEQTVVADAMKALWQYMHQEAEEAASPLGHLFGGVRPLPRTSDFNLSHY